MMFVSVVLVGLGSVTISGSPPAFFWYIRYCKTTYVSIVSSSSIHPIINRLFRKIVIVGVRNLYKTHLNTD